MQKITAISPANIAFIKYWGRKDHQLFLPLNNSISMTMDQCLTKTTIALTDKKEDEIMVKFFDQNYIKLQPDSIKNQDLFKQISRIRLLSDCKQKVKIYSENNFPADAGIASSSSSFCALTSALLLIYGLSEKFEDKKELSRQIRLCGSGSAIRSALGGFVEFLAGNTHEDNYAVQIADENYWDLVDIVAVVKPEKKKLSSSQGHEIADTSPYLKTRIKEMQARIKQCREAIINKDIEKLGVATEQDCISMLMVMMTSNPPIYYLSGDSMAIIHEVLSWRENDKLPVYFSYDAGANAHLICESKNADEVNKRLKSLPYVKWTIKNKPSRGVRIINKHLF